MADTAARLAISARRNEVARFTIAVTGIDMTGVAMAMQIRLGRDVPGTPLISLATVNTLAAEGLKMNGVTVTNGVPTSIIKGRINASTMTDPAKVPYMGEVGTDSVLAYAMQWTLNGDAQTRLFGDFVVLGSAFGSDNAPSSRPASYGGSLSYSGGSSSGTLSFGDQVIQVVISDAEIVGALVSGAAQSKIDAETARDKARDWAEGTGEPGGPGSASAKAWAAKAAESTKGLGNLVEQGVAVPGAGDSVCPGGYTYISQQPFTASGTLSSVDIYASGPCTISLFTASVVNGASATTLALQFVALKAGLNHVSSFNPEVQVGQFLGFSQTAQSQNIANNVTVVGRGVSGTLPAIYTAQYGRADVGETFNVTGEWGTLQMGWTIASGIQGQIAVTSNRAAEDHAALGERFGQGMLPATEAPAALPAGSFFSFMPVGRKGSLSRISFWAKAAGSVMLFTCVLGSGVARRLAAQTITVAGPGLVEVTSFNPSVEVGQYIGAYSAGGVLGYTGAGGVGTLFSDGPLQTTDTAIRFVGDGNLVHMGWEIVTAGALKEIGGSQAALRGAGFGLLNGADNTGGADATAALTAARSANPSPNVPAGTYSVTALPLFGDGLSGPGRVLVNGVAVSLPPAPEQGARFLKMRAFLVSQIRSSSALIFNGDSITAGEGASSPENTYVSLVTRFANLGIAVDEPTYVSFSAAEMAAKRLTIANPAGVTNGTAGPVSTSLMLQPGQSISMIGIYERVDAIYTGVANGVLAFAFNGATYKTVSCATTGSDVLAVAGATGQTASGTYSITNTGSAAVEITSLIRLGVTVANSPPRLFVCRFARGGYRHDNYKAAQIASMQRIATAIGGGTKHFLMTFLGTNEAGANVRYADLKPMVADHIAAWVASGIPVSRMLPIMPWRWQNGSPFEEELAAIREAYKEAGITRVVQTDGYDMIAQGLSTSSVDGHPNDAGHLVVFNAVVAALSSANL